MSYFCSTCCISLASRKSLKRHHASTKHLNRLENNLKHVCNCGRSFTLPVNLYRHRKICTYTEPVIETKIEESSQVIQLLQAQLSKKDTEMRERLDKKDKEMDELRNQVEILIEKTSSNTPPTTTNCNTNNSNNHIETQNNIEIIVNSFGSENIDHLTDQIICKLIKTAPFTSVPQLIEKIHFDPEHPENHNIKITNKKLNYAEIVRNNKWVTANKKKVIDDVIQKSYDLLDEKYTENKDDISEKRQERFQNFQEKYEQADEELLRNIKNDVDLLLINGTN
jgi:hypothetical protein